MYDIKNTEDFVNYLYNRLPQLYIRQDNDNKKFLYRYLYILVAGGYNKLINSQYKTVLQKQYDSQGFLITKTLPNGEIVPDYKEVLSLDGLGISDLDIIVDPMKCPQSIFPYLYESFGLKYMEDIKIDYQRKFLSNIGFMNKMKGSIIETKFIISVLTGMNNDAWYEIDEITGERKLCIVMYAENISDIEGIETEASIVSMFLSTRIPFYLTPDISVRVIGNFLSDNTYYVEALLTTKGYKLNELSEEEFKKKLE